MRTTLLVALLATALPNIAAAQNTQHRQLLLPFHATGVVLLSDADVFLDGDKVVINPTENALEDMIKRAIRFTYDFGELSDSNLGKLEIAGPHYTSAVLDYRKLEGHTIFKDASGDALVARIDGKGILTGQQRTFTQTGKFLGGTGKFDAASGSFEGKAIVDGKAGTATTELTGTINLDCGVKRPAAACTAAR
jgi:hypothetical protein